MDFFYQMIHLLLDLSSFGSNNCNNSILSSPFTSHPQAMVLSAPGRRLPASAPGPLGDGRREALRALALAAASAGAGGSARRPARVDQRASGARSGGRSESTDGREGRTLAMEGIQERGTISTYVEQVSSSSLGEHGAWNGEER